MAICNTFNKLTNATGNFISFDQYAKDLTRWATESDKFRVVPSRFIALDIDFDNFVDTLLKDPTKNLNIDIPRYFQNVFENACSFCSANLPDYNSDTVKKIFWWSLMSCGLINEDIFNEKTYVKEIKYIGNINIQNYDEYEGMGYSDIFCYIPNEANIKYYISNLKNDKPLTVINQNSYIEGYTPADDSQLILSGSINAGTKYCYNNPSNFWVAGEVMDPEADKPVDEKSKKFNVNAIIVLYDVYEYNDISKPKFKDIPLGIYFPGVFDSKNQMTNNITKYISNADAYGAGTSYGLRICTRFAVTPNDNLLHLKIDAKTDNDYVAFSQVMSAFAETHAKLNELMESTINHLNAQKELYDIFKNSRTNVPYLKQVGEYIDSAGVKRPINHWFVNGRDLGQEGQSIIYEGGIAYTEQEMNDAITEWKK